MTKLYYTFIALCLSLVSTASLADSSPVFYRVNQVVSGDTVLITADKTVMLHLVGVIAFPPSTPQGSQAKAALSQLVLGQSVAVVVKKQLSNGHWIGQISLGYKDVGLTLLTQGLVFLKDNEMPLLRAMDESNYRSTEKNDENKKIGLYTGGKYTAHPTDVADTGIYEDTQHYNNGTVSPATRGYGRDSNTPTPTQSKVIGDWRTIGSGK